MFFVPLLHLACKRKDIVIVFFTNEHHYFHRVVTQLFIQILTQDKSSYRTFGAAFLFYGYTWIFQLRVPQENGSGKSNIFILPLNVSLQTSAYIEWKHGLSNNNRAHTSLLIQRILIVTTEYLLFLTNHAKLLWNMKPSITTIL